MKENSALKNIKKWHLSILVISLSIFLLIGGYYYYTLESDTIRKEKHNELKAIAGLKINQLTQWRKERLSEAEFFSMNEVIINITKKTLSDGKSSSNQKIFENLLADFKDNHGYNNIYIVSPENLVLLSLDTSFTLIDPQTISNIETALSNSRIILSDFKLSSNNGNIHLDLIAPILDSNYKPIAGIVFCINPSTYLYPLIQSWPTPSKTSETLLVRKEGDSVLFVNELRHKENTALKLTIPLASKEVPAVQAVLGKQGIFEGNDYRGIDVLSCVLPVPDTPWYMVAKVDTSEIYSELKYRAIIISVLTLGLIFLIAFGLSFIYKSRQKDIYEDLFHKEKEISEAHEKFKTTIYSIGDGVIITDKYGTIKNMNQVAEQLTGWKETAAKDLLLEEVFNIINEDTREKVKNPVVKVLKEGLIVGLANHTMLISKDGSETPIADSGAPIKNENNEVIGVVLVFRDQSDERINEKLLSSRLRLMDYATNHNLEELLTMTLDETEILTGSRIGFYHFVDTDQENLLLQAWSTRTKAEFCKAEGRGLHYPVSEAGIWVDCIHQKKPVIHNDYASMQNKKGLPEGHAEVIRELVVPVIRNDKIVAVLGVGNKRIGYTEKDVEIVNYIADVVWEITGRKRADEAIAVSETRYRRLFESAKDGILILNADSGKIVDVNPFLKEMLGYSHEELFNKELWEIGTFKNIASSKDAFIELQKNEYVRFEDMPLETKDGKHIEVEFVSNVYIVDHTKVIQCNIRDISERKMAEKVIEENDKLIKAVMDNLPIGIAVNTVDPSVDFQYVNENFVKFYRTNREALSKENDFWSAVYEDEIFREEMKKEVLADCASGNPDLMHWEDIPITRKGEETTYITARNIPLPEKKLMISTVWDVTERKRAEEALRSSEDKFKKAFFTSPDSIAITRASDGMFVSINKGFTQITGYTEEEVLGKTSLEINIWSDPEDRRNIVEALSTYGEVHNYEARFLTKESEIYGLMSATIIELNGVAHILNITRDITERKLAEEALHESEERFRRLFEASPEAVMLLDPYDPNIDWSIVDCNEMACKMNGYTYKELIGKSVDILNVVSSEQFGRDEYLKQIRSAGVMHLEAYHRHKDGHIFPVEISTSIVNFHGRELILGIDRDITERKQAEEIIKISEARLKEAQRLAKIGSWELDIISNILIWSEEIYNIFEIDSAIFGSSYEAFLDAIHPDDREAVNLAYTNSLKTRIPYSIDHRLIFADGRIKYVHEQCETFFDENDKPHHSVGTVQDITERKRVEEALKESEEIFKHFMENSPIYVFFKDENIRPIRLSKNFEQMLGKPLDELLGKTMDELFPSDLAKSMIADDQRILQKRELVIVDEELNERFYTTLKFPIIIDGQPRYLAGYTIDITDRKKAEEAIAQSEKQFRTLFMSLSDGFYISEVIYDDDGNPCDYRYIELNPRFEEIIGLSKKEIIGKSYKEIVSVDTSEWLNNYFHVAKTGESATYEFFSPEYQKYFETYSYKSTTGQISVFVRDITERKKAEETLRESERKLREAQEMAHLGFWSWKIKTGEVEWSEEVFKIFGLDPQTFTPQIDSILELSPWEEDHQRDKELIRRAIENHSPGEYEQKFLRPDKSIGYYYSTFQGIYDENDDLISIVGTVLDITERKHAEERVLKLNQELEQRVAERTAELSDLYNNAPCGYHSLNSDGCYERINDTELKWLGYSRNEVVGKILLPNILTEESKKIFFENFPRFKESGWLTDLELDFIRKDGSVLPVLLSATSIKDEEGLYLRSRSTIVDHTERKKAEEAIREANARLEESNKELEAFSYSISHDLRAPLRAMDGYAKILFEDYSAVLDAEGQRLLNTVIMSAKNMGNLIDDLLAFSRISRQGIKKSRINMLTMAQSVFDEIKSMSKLDTIEFNIDSIPDAFGDDSMIRQVWRNLIGNAIKFSSKMPNPIVEIGANINENETIYYIKDNGVGFDNRYVEKIFGVFQRLHKSSEFEGTGVGLAIVHRIIHRHGGRIWAEGKLNEGAVFYFTVQTNRLDHN